MDKVEELIRRRILVTEKGCWEWQGYRTVGGYGRICRRGKNHSIHRYVYQQVVGPIPDGLELDHLCRERACCNPEHLEPVTHKENHQRGLGAQRSREFNEKRTHCPQGHPFAGEHLYDYYNPKTGYRCKQCRTCHREQKRARRAAGLKD